MIKTTIIAVGKIKEQYYKDACDEYIKRLSSFTKLETIEITPARLPDNPNSAQIENVLKAEAGLITDKIPKGSYVISMCIEGKKMSSEQLSECISSVASNGRSNIVFIIGGSFGLSEEVKKCSDLKLSMSDMTFPHRLFRVMLFEQLYRSFEISSGGKYHK